MRVLSVLIGVSLFAISAKGQTVYSIQGALASARTNNPFLKTEGYNINIAQSDITTSKLRPNPILNNQTLLLANSKYYPSGTDIHNSVNRQVWWQITRPFQLPALRRSKIEFATQNLNLVQQGFGETTRRFSFAASNQLLGTCIIKWTLD